MANIVDEFLISLGLDSSKFDKAQEKAINRLRTMEDVQRKNSKENQKRLKATTDGYNKLRDSVIGFATALAGVNGMKDFISQTVTGNAALGRQAQLLGMSAKSLDAWGWVAEKSGGSLKGIEQSLQGMEGAWAKFKLGMGGTEFLTTMSRLGLHSESDLKNFVTLSQHLLEVKKKYGEQGALQVASALGLDQGTFLMLMRGPGHLQGLYEKAYRFDGITNKNTDDAQKLWEKWVDIKEEVSAAGQGIFHDIVPALKVVLDLTEKAVQAFEKIDKATGGNAGKVAAATGIAATIGGAGIAGRVLGGAAAGIGSGIAGAAGVGAAGVAGYGIGSWINDRFINGTKLGDWIGSLVAHGFAALGDKDAASAVAGMEPRGIRNKNPGNLRYGRFAKSHGAIGQDPAGFAIFPTMQAGKAAMADLLQSYRHHGVDTISAMVSKYAPSSENNTAAYISDVARQTGIDPNAHLTSAQYAFVQRAMMLHENGARYASMIGPAATAPMLASGGRTSVETNIHSINVNAPNATDAAGIVRSIHGELQRNTLIAGAVVGAA